MKWILFYIMVANTPHVPPPLGPIYPITVGGFESYEACRLAGVRIHRYRGDYLPGTTDEWFCVDSATGRDPMYEKLHPAAPAEMPNPSRK